MIDLAPGGVIKRLVDGFCRIQQILAGNKNW